MRKARIKKGLAVATIAGLLLALLPAPALPAPRAWARVAERPLLLRSDAGSVESQVVEDPFTIVGVTWEGASPSEILVRTRSKGRWSAWRPIEVEDDHGPDVDTVEKTHERHGSQPVWAGESDAVQFRIRGGKPTKASVTLVDTTNRTKPLFRRLHDAFTAPSAGAAPSNPGIHPRSDWDPTGSCVPREPPSYVQVTTAFIHHTAGWNTYTQAEVPSYILGICLYHRNTKEWNDIAYNFLVDRFGGIWEGRAGGIDRGVQGAHTKGFNSYSTGIALLGSFQNTGVSPSTAMQDALVNLLAWKFSIHNVDPKGTTTVVSKGSSKYAQGTTVTLNTIAGHRDAQSTSCPGDSCYVLLPSFRDRVAALWQPIPPDTYVSPLVGDFNGDGAEDGAVLRQADGTWWVTDGATGSVAQWGALSPTTGWETHLVGDFNGDGNDDLASYRNGTWTASISTGTAFTPTTWGALSPTTGWETHLVGDFNGDGNDDLASYRSADGSWATLISTGTAFTPTTWGALSPTTGWETHLVGDFNGDGNDDLASYRNGTWTASISTGAAFTPTTWGSLPSTTGWETHLVGDFNGDGNDDLASYRSADGTWATLMSTGSAATAGPSAVTLSADHYSLALSVDVDGDGSDDIAQLDAYDGTWHAGSVAGDRLTFSTLEDAPYRTTVTRQPSRSRAAGPFLTYFAQELRWISTETGYGLSNPNSVTRLWGADRYETAAAVSATAFPAGAPLAYVATGENYPDALTAVPAAAEEGAPILLTRTGSLPSTTRAELTRLAPQQIVVLGGYGAVSDGVLGELGTLAPGGAIRRAGPTRYETAVEASRAVFDAGVPVVYITSGTDWPEAVVAGPPAAFLGGPLLLVMPSGIPPAVRTELLRLRPERIVVVGSEASVSTAVMDQLTPYTTGSVIRMTGYDRYGTAAAVSAGVFPAGNSPAYVATGLLYPDGLTGGVLAAIDGAPLLLTHPETLPAPTEDELSRLQPTAVTIFGGEGAVSSAVASELAKFQGLSALTSDLDPLPRQ